MRRLLIISALLALAGCNTGQQHRPVYYGGPVYSAPRYYNPTLGPDVAGAISGNPGVPVYQQAPRYSGSCTSYRIRNQVFTDCY